MIRLSTSATCRECGPITPTPARMKAAPTLAAAVDRAAEAHMRQTGHTTYCQSVPTPVEDR